MNSYGNNYLTDIPMKTYVVKYKFYGEVMSMNVLSTDETSCKNCVANTMPFGCLIISITEKP